MKHLLLALLLSTSLTALADGLRMTPTLAGATTQQQQQQTTTTDSTSTASNSGVTTEVNAGDVVFNSTTPSVQEVKYSGTQKIKNVPSVSGPPLTTSNDTCMGSTSGSVNIAGLGIGGGSTWTDANCKRLKNARELWNMGMKAAGMELMCLDSENRKALKATGYACSPTESEAAENARLEKSKGSVVSTAPDVTVSPIVGY